MGKTFHQAPGGAILTDGPWLFPLDPLGMFRWSGAALVPGFLCSSLGAAKNIACDTVRCYYMLLSSKGSGCVFFHRKSLTYLLPRISNGQSSIWRCFSSYGGFPSKPRCISVRFLPFGDGKCVHRFVSSRGAMYVISLGWTVHME